jgi:hypothetical protein
MRSTDFCLLAALLLTCAAWASPAEASGKVYRWVDENGVVHFGDAIPPEYSRERHEVLDGRGVRVVIHEPKAADSPVRDDRDRALLATYRSVAEIESVRDRRIGYLDAQNEVVFDRLDFLQARKEELEDNPAAINELALVEQRIREYHAEIERRNAEIGLIRDQFDADILRYRELTGQVKPEAPREAVSEASDR